MPEQGGAVSHDPDRVRRSAQVEGAPVAHEHGISWDGLVGRCVLRGEGGVDASGAPGGGGEKEERGT